MGFDPPPFLLQLFDSIISIDCWTVDVPVEYPRHAFIARGLAWALSQPARPFSSWLSACRDKACLGNPKSLRDKGTCRVSPSGKALIQMVEAVNFEWFSSQQRPFIRNISHETAFSALTSVFENGSKSLAKRKQGESVRSNAKLILQAQRRLSRWIGK